MSSIKIYITITFLIITTILIIYNEMLDRKRRQNE